MDSKVAWGIPHGFHRKPNDHIFHFENENFYYSIRAVILHHPNYDEKSTFVLMGGEQLGPAVGLPN